MNQSNIGLSFQKQNEFPIWYIQLFIYKDNNANYAYVTYYLFTINR
jgi:hypothetical protein